MVQLCLPPLFEKHSLVENEIGLQFNNLFIQSKYLPFCIGRIIVIIECETLQQICVICFISEAHMNSFKRKISS